MSDLDALIRNIKDRAIDDGVPVSRHSDAVKSGPQVTHSHPARITPEVLFLLPVPDVIEHYYQLILRRSADAQGMSLYQPLIQAGMPALILLFDLSRSAEGRSRDVPIDGLGLARALYYLAKLAKKIRCQRPVWSLLQGLMGYYQRKVQSVLPSALALDQQADEKLGALAYTIQQLYQRHNELEKELRLTHQSLEKSQRDVDRAYAILQSKQHQQLLQVDAGSMEKPAATPVALQAALDAYYLAFEDTHRGSSAEIQAGLNDYEAIIQQLPAGSEPALDLGCGRGEWLLWLQERGIAATGVDGNPVMVEHCQQRGLAVIHADLLSHLQSLPSHSQRLVTSFHVIEHLPFDVLFVMLREIHRVLVPGGWMILETPNPENVLVGSHTFYHDFSHRSPITPSSIEFLGQYQGFVNTQILRRNPYPKSARVVGSDALTERVNGHLCGPQDFALIAQTPVAS